MCCFATLSSIFSLNCGISDFRWLFLLRTFAQHISFSSFVLNLNSRFLSPGHRNTIYVFRLLFSSSSSLTPVPSSLVSLSLFLFVSTFYSFSHKTFHSVFGRSPARCLSAPHSLTSHDSVCSIFNLSVLASERARSLILLLWWTKEIA